MLTPQPQPNPFDLAASCRGRHPAELSGDAGDIRTNRSFKVLQEHIRKTDSLKPLPLAARLQYECATPGGPDSYGGKVKWRETHDTRPILQIIQDKIAAKEYFHMLGLPAPKIIRRVDGGCLQLPRLEDLPLSYVRAR